MTTFKGAIIKEQGVVFGIVSVKAHVLTNHTEANHLIITFQQKLSVVPVVLMAQNSQGIPTYYGRRDIVAFLANVQMNLIPWKEFTIS